MRQNRPCPTLAFPAPNLCRACALASPVTFLTGDHVMQMGFGQISPSASSTRDLGTRLTRFLALRPISDSGTLTSFPEPCYPCPAEGETKASGIVGGSCLDPRAKEKNSGVENETNPTVSKISIVIGFSGAYLSRNRRVITWVSHLNFELFVFVWLPTTTHMLFRRKLHITRQ